MKHKIIIFILIFSFCHLIDLQAKIITIESIKGKAMTVELVAVQERNITIKRTKDNREFTIATDSLSPQSQRLIAKEATALKERYPPLDADVSVSKRRKADNDSYYMKKMVITSKITLTNKNHKIPCPPCKINMIFIGQDQRNPDIFSLLSNQQFKVTPTPKGTQTQTSPFETSYDSDNKGEGNIGGYKYVGYLLIVSDKNNKVIYTKTLYSKIKKALDLDISITNKLKLYAPGTKLNQLMAKPAK